MTLTERDQVRLEVGDTDAADPILTDDEVDNFVVRHSLLDSAGGTLSVNVLAAAADAAGAICAEYARQFDFSEDGQSFSRSQRVRQYRDLERKLRAQAGGKSIVLSLAGTEPVS